MAIWVFFDGSIAHIIKKGKGIHMSSLLLGAAKEEECSPFNEQSHRIGRVFAEAENFSSQDIGELFHSLWKKSTSFGDRYEQKDWMHFQHELHVRNVCIALLPDDGYGPFLPLSDSEFKHLFHKLWCAAVGSDGYIKREWNTLAQKLQKRKIFV